jgi:two-component system, NtrC family, nitrogen regulation response regulator NtrX
LRKPSVIARSRGRSAAPIPLPLLGASDSAASGRHALELAAGHPTPVLVFAEPGCRPRTVAESLHARTRAGSPFVAVDCGIAGPADMDTRLFGTLSRRTLARDLESIGADAAIVTAGAGTLFLQDIDELPASAQRRLARILRDGEVRLASRQSGVTLPFRLVASTTRDLETEVREGRFRPDLLRRFAACRIVVPPLRQRVGDLAAIIERVVADLGGAPRSFTQPAVTVLAALPWTGNLDELAAVLGKVLVRAAAIVTQEDVLAHVPIDGAFSRRDLTASLREARRRFERDHIAPVLERHQWRMSEAARALGIERANLYRKTRQLGIARVPRAEVS